MHVEISVALNFVISYLYNKLPRRRVNMLAEELEKGIKRKFEGHWYFDKPSKGSGYRSIKVNGDNIDPVIVSGAYDCGLDIDEIKEYLPNELTLWIDPMEVSYKIGEKGQVKVLYSNRKEEVIIDNTECEIQVTNHGFNPTSRGFNPDAACFRPIDAIMSSSLSSLSLSPSSPTPSSTWSTSPSSSIPHHGSSNSVNNNRSFQHKLSHHALSCFTTATFAQTKFGSTKLKTQAKRPTEFGNYFRQKNASLQHVPNGFNSPQSPANNGFSSPQTAPLNGFYSPQTAPQSGFQSPQSPARPRSLSLSPRDSLCSGQRNRVLFSQLHQKQEQSRRQLMPTDLLSPYTGNAPNLSPFYRAPFQRGKVNQHNQLSPDASSLGLDELIAMNNSSSNNYSLNDFYSHSTHTAMSPDEPQTVNPQPIDMIHKNSVPFIPHISPQTMLYGEDSIRIPSPIQYDSITGSSGNNPFHHLLLAS